MNLQQELAELQKNQKRALEIQQEREQMPETKIILELKSLSISIYIFEQNYRELKELIESLLANNPNHITSIPSLIPILDITRKEVARRLSNFVSAAFALRDAANRLYGKLHEPTGLFPEYDVKKQEIEFDCYSLLIQLIRNYFIHRKVPSSVFRIEKVNSKTFEYASVIKIALDDLREYDKWNSFSNKCPELAQQDVDVLNIATKYRDKIMSFYQWVQGRQLEIHKAALDQDKKKEMEFLLLDLEIRVDACRLALPNQIPLTEYQIFINFLTKEQLEELEVFEVASTQRLQKTIQMLEEKVILPTSLKNKLFRFYRRLETGVIY